MVNQALRASDAVIVFIDLQEGIVNVGATTDQERLRTCVAALAELAKVLAIPTLISCVPTTSGTVSPLVAEIGKPFPDAAQYVRKTANALEDEAFRTALEVAGRRTVILAGVVSEVAIALTATAANRLDYSVIVAVDACSGLDARSESATFMHLSAQGVALSSVPAIAAELAGDFTAETGRAAIRALQSIVSVNRHDHSSHSHETGTDHGHNGNAQP